MSGSDRTTLRKYPRTPHLAGSSVQADDDDARVPISALVGQGALVYEEKLDGANAAFRFDGAGELLVQSRGHYLSARQRNAPRERDWALLKDWLAHHRDAFLSRFEDRYVVYGEWMAITHSVFYDRLPTYFLEFDILDLATDTFLDTAGRRALCAGLPIAAVPVLARSDDPLAYAAMVALVGPSVFKTPADAGREGRWEDNLRRACVLVGDDYERRLAKLDNTALSEGLYVKLERGGQVVGRYKWVRPGFTQTVLVADEHWQSRFPVPNLLDRPRPDFPVHLARCQAASAMCYDPDDPWAWAPWTRGAMPI